MSSYAYPPWSGLHLDIESRIRAARRHTLASRASLAELRASVRELGEARGAVEGYPTGAKAVAVARAVPDVSLARQTIMPTNSPREAPSAGRPYARGSTPPREPPAPSSRRKSASDVLLFCAEPSAFNVRLAGKPYMRTPAATAKGQPSPGPHPPLAYAARSPQRIALASCAALGAPPAETNRGSLRPGGGGALFGVGALARAAQPPAALDEAALLRAHGAAYVHSLRAARAALGTMRSMSSPRRAAPHAGSTPGRAARGNAAARPSTAPPRSGGVAARSLQPRPGGPHLVLGSARSLVPFAAPALSAGARGATGRQSAGERGGARAARRPATAGGARASVGAQPQPSGTLSTLGEWAVSPARAELLAAGWLTVELGEAARGGSWPAAAAVGAALLLALVHVRTRARFRHATRRLVSTSNADVPRNAASRSTTCERDRVFRMAMHDMRSPLLSLQQLTEVLSNAPRSTRLDDPVAAASLGAMRTCTALLERLVSDVLDLERLGAGRLELTFEPFAVRELFADARTAYQALAEKKGVRLCFEDPPPDVAARLFVGDRLRLLQCLGNGISNAVKFSEAGADVVLRAWLEHADGAALHLAVSDSGEGLAADELAVLNTGGAFTQVGRGKLQGSAGTGLGLSIVRQLLWLHSGSTLKLHSTGRGAGTCFTLVLRLATAMPPDTPPPAPTPSSFDGHRAHRLPVPPGFRCLHVEDDKVLQLAISLRIFKQAGIPYDVASDGVDALAAMASRVASGARPYDVVLLDNRMPRLGGAATTRRLRAYNGVVIIGMTGDPSGSEEREAFEAAGLDACVDKTSNGYRRVRQLLSEIIVARARAPVGRRAA
ncbi:hypothetical protein KFE25_004826 [Diacronema lutheri]|uniref:histidine kinase n=1 Tax=Diacronema lutheri TaxID=2081491 RepID=A0A8J5XPY5_DIALT|nr:hypothetical protein KFE25_004826 [Diacronema lutheri]